MEWLIKAGAGVNVKNKNNWTPLHFAVIFGTPKMIEMLIKNGAHVNDQGNDDGNTPLHVIAADGDSDEHYASAKLLIDNGADVNLKNAEDKTPLELATYEKSKDNFSVPLFQFISLKSIISNSFL